MEMNFVDKFPDVRDLTCENLMGNLTSSKAFSVHLEHIQSAVALSGDTP